MQSLIHSTCCSIETIIFVSTEGLPGPLMREQVRKAGDSQTKPARSPVAVKRSIGS